MSPTPRAAPVQAPESPPEVPRAAAPPLDALDAFRSPDVSALDVIDHLLDKGCVVTGRLVLGLANVDLVVVDLSLVLAEADRMLDAPAGAEGAAPAPEPPAVEPE